MSIFTTYTEIVVVKYTSKWFSRATLFNILVFLTAVIAPFLIAYRMQGFWTKLETVSEFPKVLYKHEALVMLDVKNSDTSYGNLIWTTFSGLHSMIETKVTPFIMSREGDTNMDGIKEFLEIDVFIPLQNNENVVGASVILLFDYQLTKYANLQMESMIFVSHLSSRTGNRLEVTGDLELVQKQPLWFRIRDDRFSKDVVPRNSSTGKDYSLSKIIREYAARNVSTILKNKYELWENDGDLRDEFHLKVRVEYLEQSYACWAGFWATLKWAWVQYIAIFIVIFPFLKLFQRIVYKSRMFETVLTIPWIKKVV